MALGRYLRFEDALYLPGVLDKIISEARRDRAEYGFAQLRLVLCFLRWANLKEAPQERIHSPLLLLPVELTKKKGVRDSYVLDPTTSEAEVNPALRHHLKELYNLNLPERIDLRETTLEQFYEALQAQIQSSEPGVTLRKIDRPQIQLIHEKARQRVICIVAASRQTRARARHDGVTSPSIAMLVTSSGLWVCNYSPKRCVLPLCLCGMRPAPPRLRVNRRPTPERSKPAQRGTRCAAAKRKRPLVLTCGISICAVLRWAILTIAR